MGLARQTAITRNTDALFIIASRSSDEFGSFLPSEPFRYWAVVYSNRAANQNGTWTLATDWTEIPSGTVFMGLVGQGHNTLGWSRDGQIPSPGTPFTPRVQASSAGEWQCFNNFTNLTVTWDGGASRSNLTVVPFIGFRSSGKGFAHRMTGGTGGNPPTHMAVIIGEGAVAEGSQLVLRSTNNITHVETDSRSGRVVVRPRESYR